MTGHGFVTSMECDAANNNGQGAGNTYRRNREASDANERTQRLLTEHGNGMARPTQATSAGTTAGGATAGASVNSAGPAGTVGSVSAGAPTNPAGVNPSQQDVDKAAQCINAFRSEAFAQMQKHCKDNEATFNANAGTPTQRAVALEERDRAYEAMRAAEQEVPPNPNTIRHARGAYNRAAQSHNIMQRNACLASQARALNSGNVPACREPSTAYDPRGNNGGPQTNSGEI